MLTRLGQYADRALEYGWLAAAVFTPLFFNVYSSRVFEPDKISTLRSFVLVMLLLWIIKLLEGGVRAYSQSEAATRAGRLADAVGGAAERGLPSWLGFLRVPMIVPILVYAVTYLISTLFSVTVESSLFGSYQRLQGTYTQYTYMLLGIIVIANLRTRVQLERLITFMILTSVPVVLYGFLQATPLLNANFKLDPLPWAGDTATRVASTMGNAIFVAAWLIMVTPLILYRLFNGLSETFTARAAMQPNMDAERMRTIGSRRIQADSPSYGWAVAAVGVGLFFVQALVFYGALKLMAGLTFPDQSMAWILPVALVFFFLTCLTLERVGSKVDDSRLARTALPIVGLLIFGAATLGIMLDWKVQRESTASGETSLVAQSIFNADRILWVLFLTLLWGAISAGLYTLGGSERLKSGEHSHSPIVRNTLNVGYGLLLLMHILCIYLTQSRGPWLGLGAGFVTFALAMWLVGRRTNVRWMTRFGGAVSAVVLAGAIFVGLLNIPDSPLKALSNMPLLGRGIERLSTLARTEDGTGKVRTLIWQGATDLILSNPARALIGWGPEAMYVAYNPYYPAELAKWELRNATPDRSHNVEFDQLVTMGVVGLLAYYFLVGAFFFYAMRILKRLHTTRDRLLVIALMSAMTAHFIEIQTGIQIAATWTYFYLIIGMMAAFGYYVTNHLRPISAIGGEDPGLVAGAEVAGRRTRDEGRRAVLDDGESAPAVGAPQTVVASAARTGSGGSRKERTASGTATSIRGASTPITPPAQARRRTSQALGSERPVEGRPFYSEPWKLVVYGITAILVSLAIWNVNTASVRADSEYKLGLQYDGVKQWHEAIAYYRKAIDLQPTQDYYYLFLGRAWMEFARQVDQERAGSQIVENVKNQYSEWRDDYNWRIVLQVPVDVSCSSEPQYGTDAKRAEERLCRMRQSEYVLNKAHELNPLNTDHYANLGRLYLYWADDTGAGDKSKNKLAVANFEAAVERTPGNAQLWDELSLAYVRDGQFNRGMEALRHSQEDIDNSYARTPFIRGQLYQERLLAVRQALLEGTALPTDGETDYGKLVLETGRAYSETLGIDPTQFLDSSYKVRLDFMLTATEPFTKTNTALDAQTVRNALTSTIALALQNTVATSEGRLATYLREQSAYGGSASVVPTNTLQTLWQDPKWAVTQGETRQWLDPNIPSIANNAVLAHNALGYIYSKTGAPARAREEYTRALALDPNNADAIAELKALPAP